MARSDIDVFQNLYLRAQVAGTRIREAILAQVGGPWRHDIPAEDRIRGVGLEEGEVIALVREPLGAIDASGLVLWPENDGYRVANIVPREVGELAIPEYNAILQDFVARVAQPAAEAGRFAIELTTPRQGLTDWVPEGAAAALRRFSGAANKSTGSAHPADRKRWNAFLIEVHRAGRRLETDRLVRWLIEVEGWPDAQAHELAIEYDFAIELLRQYDNAGS